MNRDEAEALAMVAQLGAPMPTPPWSPDYGACVCGARRGESCTDHSEIVAFQYVGTPGEMKLVRVQQGGNVLFEGEPEATE